jgi:23S rRNA (uridine2552-2'-O)-methyltransferase
MTRRSQSSSRWLQEHFNDPYVRRAQAGGWRSRAVFKLEEADRRERLLRRGAIVLDPGRRPKGRVIASDILPTQGLTDVAPSLSGMDAIDQPRAMHLAGLALDMAGRVLKPGGAALIKVFEGAGSQELVGAARRQFESVRFIKPAASRARSAETYLVASGLRLV